MSYPINPPASFYVHRDLLGDATWLGSGMWASKAAAGRALKRFVDRQADGPELRVWTP